jgi:small subunit ribosomal protein S6
MSKYEIDLLIAGSLTPAAAAKVAAPLIALIDKQDNYQVDEWGKKSLAYKINKEDSAYYYIFNFECTEPAIIKEFIRVSNITKNVLRKLIINLEKDYGYKASVNEKKIKKSKLLQGNYEKSQQAYLTKKAKYASEIDGINESAHLSLETFNNDTGDKNNE